MTGSLGLGLGIGPTFNGGFAAPNGDQHPGDNLLLETGDNFLLETGDALLFG